MRNTIASVVVGWLGFLGACVGAPGDPVLRIEPTKIDLELELGVPRRVPITVFADDVDVTADTTFAVEGKLLGSVDPTTGFAASASIAGLAQVAATFDGQTIRTPVHVTLRSRRFENAPLDAPAWFREGTETIIADPVLEPGDGTVLPPNLGRLDVHFAADDFEDVHELAVTAPDIDIRVYTIGSPGARTIPLTPTEWYAIAETNRGDTAELAVRSLRVIARENVHTARATLRIADLPITREILFTGRVGTEMPQMWSYDLTASRTAAWMPDLPAGSCVGCHVAVSKDGRRIAAGGSNGTIGGGVILDAWSRGFTAPYNAANNWIAAAYDPSGTLLTTNGGHLTWRDGLTAEPIKELPTDIPASQPAVSNNGRFIAYVGGLVDTVSSQQPVTLEMRIQPWSPSTGTLSPGRVLVEPTPGEILKLPDFSPDDEWVVYSKVRAGGVSVFARPADGRFIPIELVKNADFARFASPIATVRAGELAPEPITWLVMKRYTAVGVRSQDKVGQLWAAAFFPERGILSRPFHLPGQRPDVAVLHAPLALP